MKRSSPRLGPFAGEAFLDGLLGDAEGRTNLGPGVTGSPGPIDEVRQAGYEAGVALGETMSFEELERVRADGWKISPDEMHRVGGDDKARDGDVDPDSPFAKGLRRALTDLWNMVWRSPRRAERP